MQNFIPVEGAGPSRDTVLFMAAASIFTDVNRLQIETIKAACFEEKNVCSETLGLF